MSNKKFYWVMLGVNGLLVVAIIGCVVTGDKMLKKKSDIIWEKRLENAVVEKEQVALLQAKQDLEKYSELQQIARQIVPQEKDQALTIRQLVALADKAGVSIGSISFPSSTLGNTAVKKTEGSTTTASDISQAKPVAGINGVLALDITVVSDQTKPSSYARIVSFLENLENNRRTAQVSQISIQPDSKNPNLLSLSLTLTVYIKP